MDIERLVDDRVPGPSSADPVPAVEGGVASPSSSTSSLKRSAGDMDPNPDDHDHDDPSRSPESSNKRRKTEDTQDATPAAPNEDVEMVDRTDANRLVEDIGLQLSCGCCTELCYNPVMLLPCQHYFCGSCFTLWTRNSGVNCPACRSTITSVLPSRAIQSLIEVYLRSVPSRERLPREKEQADEIYTAGSDIRIPTPRPRSPEIIPPQDNDAYHRPCPHCPNPNDFNWYCPQPIVLPSVDINRAALISNGIPPGHATCGSCDHMHATGAPATSKCDFCRKSFCGLVVPTRCHAKRLREAKPAGLEEVTDILGNPEVYSSFDINAVEFDFLFDYLREVNLTPRDIYLGIVDSIARDADKWKPLLEKGLFPNAMPVEEVSNETNQQNDEDNEEEVERDAGSESASTSGSEAGAAGGSDEHQDEDAPRAAEGANPPSSEGAENNQTLPQESVPANETIGDQTDNSAVAVAAEVTAPPELPVPVPSLPEEPVIIDTVIIDTVIIDTQPAVVPDEAAPNSNPIDTTTNAESTPPAPSSNPVVASEPSTAISGNPANGTEVTTAPEVSTMNDETPVNSSEGVMAPEVSTTNNETPVNPSEGVTAPEVSTTNNEDLVNASEGATAPEVSTTTNNEDLVNATEGVPIPETSTATGEDPANVTEGGTALENSASSGSATTVVPNASQNRRRRQNLNRICRHCSLEVFYWGSRQWWIRERAKAFTEGTLPSDIRKRKDCPEMFQVGEDGVTITGACSREEDASHAREFNHIPYPTGWVRPPTPPPPSSPPPAPEAPIADEAQPQDIQEQPSSEGQPALDTQMEVEPQSDSNVVNPPAESQTPAPESSIAHAPQQTSNVQPETNSEAVPIASLEDLMEVDSQPVEKLPDPALAEAVASSHAIQELASTSVPSIPAPLTTSH